MATTTATAAAAPEVRYGIVGVGMMGREHLHNLAHLAGEVGRAEPPVRLRVTCLADPHPESLQLGLQLAADLALPAPQVYTRTPWPSYYLNSPFALMMNCRASRSRTLCCFYFIESMGFRVQKFQSCFANANKRN